MRRVLFPALVGIVLANAVWVGLAAGADEPVTKQLYGGGVHAYFSKEYKEAHELLSTAVASKSQDPRVYYFRGLAQLQLGRPDEAKADFATGADLEATAADDLFNVDKALERIQGKARLSIETARVAARNKAAKKRLTENEERFNRIRSNEPNILEGVAPPPAKAPATKKAEPVEPTEGEPKKTAEPPKANPTGEPAKTEGAAEPPKEGTADFFREAPLPVTRKKVVVADDAKPAPAKTAEAAPATPKEPEPKPAEPKVAVKAKEDPAPRPASPPGKKATAALARIVGNFAQEYANEMAQSIQKAQQQAGGLAPPPSPKPQP